MFFVKILVPRRLNTFFFLSLFLLYTSNRNLLFFKKLEDTDKPKTNRVRTFKHHRGHPTVSVTTQDLPDSEHPALTRVCPRWRAEPAVALPVDVEPTVFVGQLGGRNTIPPTGPQQQEYVFSSCWRPGVWDPGVGRFALAWGLWLTGGQPPCLLPLCSLTRPFSVHSWLSLPPLVRRSLIGLGPHPCKIFLGLCVQTVTLGVRRG